MESRNPSTSLPMLSSLAGPPARGFRVTLLAVALATGLAPALAVAQAREATADMRRHYDIPAGSLGPALDAFARISGLNLSWNRNQVAGLSSAGLHGEYAPQHGLQTLLDGTGLWARFDGDGRGARLERGVVADDGVTVTAPLSVEGASIAENGFDSLFAGRTLYDQRQMSEMPVGNGDFTSVLRRQTSVQFNDNQLNGAMPGEISPADISIHGAKPNQNLFLVDGATINNDINPSGMGITNVNFPDRLPSNQSQGLAIDTSLLERMEVYDSNIPARFGGFNGGVIDVETRSPARQASGRISMTTTRDAWTRYHLSEEYKESARDPAAIRTDYGYQPEFTKTTWRAHAEGYLGENFGLSASAVRMVSKIYDQVAYNYDVASDPVGDSVLKDTRRQIDNYTLKGVWNATERLDLTANIGYAPQTGRYFNLNAIDGDFDLESGGYSAGLKALWRGDRITVDQRLSWSRLQSSRTAKNDYYQSWYYSDEKNWGSPDEIWDRASTYGSRGPMQQRQESLGYTLQLDAEELNWGDTVHRLSGGIGLSTREGVFERKRDFTEGDLLTGTRNCIDANGVEDTRHCSTSPVWYLDPWEDFEAGDGQVATRLVTYAAGKVEARETAWSAWIEDAVQWGRLSGRAGLRVDGDDYMDKTTVAPRLSLAWDVLGNGRTRLIAGANRYYGRNMFEYRLADGRSRMKWQQDRSVDDLLWGERYRPSLTVNRFTELDIPFDDEYVAGVEQTLWGASWSLKYVRRNGKDQIMTEQVRGDHPDPSVDVTRYTVFTNKGYSRSQNLSLNVSLLQPLQIGDSSTTAELGLDWSDIDSNNTYFTEQWTDAMDNMLIRYDGEFMRYGDRPADNYNRPWTARLGATTRIPALGLEIGNFLRLRAAFSRMEMTREVVEHNGEMARVFDRIEHGTAFSWDMRIHWQQDIGKRQGVFSNLDISNLLDRVNVSGAPNISPISEIGRQFTLELGYMF